VLSSIIADNPEQAQEYVERFSAFYRTILKTGNHALISLHDEMGIVRNYLYLQKMRFENNLISSIHIVSDQQRVFVPPLAIQMLVENAIKHNTITGSRNLCIDIYADDGFIIVKNNLQKKHETILSTSTGHKSIMGRYALITDIKPLFTETETSYIAQLPLLNSKDKVQYRLKEEAVL
jgi:two-component system LytT family sensor kinase